MASKTTALANAALRRRAAFRSRTAPPAVVLAAGEGTRLRPFTETQPKVMLPVANRPILEHVLRALSEAGVRDIVLVVGYRHERVRDHFGDGRKVGLRIRYVEQAQQLGTGHAVLQAQKALRVLGRRSSSDGRQTTFLVVNGDNLIEAHTVRALLGARGGEAALAVVRSPHTRGYGVVQRRGARITEIKEKPRDSEGGLINTGLYRFSPSIFSHLKQTRPSEAGSLDLTAAIQGMVEEGREVRSIQTDALWADAVYPWDLLGINGRLLETQKPGPLLGQVASGATLRGPVSLGRDSVIHPGCVVVGPVAIGERCEIGPHAVLLPGTTLGDGVTVGSFCEVRQSLLMGGVHLKSHVSVGHSVLAEGVHLGTGTVTEWGPSTIELEGDLHHVETGVFLGENTQVGDRVLLRAGRILGTHCQVASGAIVSTHLPSHSRIL